VNATESAQGKHGAMRTRWSDFDPATRDRFLAHALLPAQWYLQAQRFRRWHIAQVPRLFDEIEILVVPATPCAAPPIGTPTLRESTSPAESIACAKQTRCSTLRRYLARSTRCFADAIII